MSMLSFKHRLNSIRTTVAIFVTALFLNLISLLVAPVVGAQDFTQGYSSDDSLIRGSIIALNKDNSNKVEVIATDRMDDIFGVVVAANDSALTITADRTGVFVATSGRFDVLVADYNGPIAAGEPITLSPIEGVGMLADADHGMLVGHALVDFNPEADDSTVLSTVTAKDLGGNSIEIAIGRILVEVAIGPNPDARGDMNAPKFLVNLSASIAGKPVSAVRIYASLAVILIASGIAGSLLYSAVRNSIVSIGRNPLSKRSVLAGLAQVVVIGVVIFLSGLVAVYLILKI